VCRQSIKSWAERHVLMEGIQTRRPNLIRSGPMLGLQEN
jgi:hypothetical protein